MFRRRRDRRMLSSHDKTLQGVHPVTLDGYEREPIGTSISVLTGVSLLVAYLNYIHLSIFTVVTAHVIVVSELSIHSTTLVRNSESTVGLVVFRKRRSLVNLHFVAANKVGRLDSEVYIQ